MCQEGSVISSPYQTVVEKGRANPHTCKKQKHWRLEIKNCTKPKTQIEMECLVGEKKDRVACEGINNQCATPHEIGKNKEVLLDRGMPGMPPESQERLSDADSVKTNPKQEQRICRKMGNARRLTMVAETALCSSRLWIWVLHLSHDALHDCILYF